MALIRLICRNLVSYRRLASLLTRRPSKDRGIDTALAKLSQYESKFRDLLARFSVSGLPRDPQCLIDSDSHPRI